MDEGFNTVCMEILRREVVPALGCTEPVAVALASALAARDLGGEPDRLEVLVSGNLFKNGMGVMVPGTGQAGLDIAAAAGALAGDPELGLEVLRNITPEIAERAKAMLAADKVSVGLADTDKILFVEVVARSGDSVARVLIEDAHTRVTRRELNGQTLFELSPPPEARDAGESSDWPLSLAKIWAFASDPSPEAIAYVMATAELNAAAAEEGLKGDYGLQVGKSLMPHPNDILGDDAASYAIRMAAAASDLRMAGAMMPVFSNSGSGNQGLACTIPVLSIARRIGAGDDQLARALLVSHLVSIHIKHYVGKLSALCGAITASTGAACGLVYLLGGDVDAMGRAIRNMAGDLAGMICDGAKFTCALKVATTTGAAIKAARLALNNQAPGSDNGIVDADAETSIHYLGKLAGEGMTQTDKVILDIMIEKKAKHAHDK